MEEQDRDLATRRVIYGQQGGNLDFGPSRFQVTQMSAESAPSQPIEPIDTQLRFAPIDATASSVIPASKVQVLNPLMDDTTVMPARPDSICYRCNRQGHFATDCVAATDRDGNTLTSEKRDSRRRERSRGRRRRSRDHNHSRNRDRYDKHKNRITDRKHGDRSGRDRGKRHLGKGRPRVHATHSDSGDSESDDSEISPASDSESEADDELTAHLAQSGLSRHRE